MRQRNEKERWLAAIAKRTVRTMGTKITPEYADALRRLSGEEKWKTAFRLYWSARKLKAARLREQHPEWTEEQVQERVKEIFLYART